MQTDTDITILLIDDDEADREAIQRGLRKHHIPNPIVLAKDGFEGLKKRRELHAKGIACVTLIDLNMPVMNGFDFLDAVRGDEAIADSVIFVLSTSSHQNDLARAYQKKIAGYITKENAGNDYAQLIVLLDQYRQLVAFPEVKVPQ
jgi:CheY-like chemotaxis protein